MYVGLRWTLAIILWIFASYLVIANNGWLFFTVAISSFLIIDTITGMYRKKMLGKKLKISIKIEDNDK